MSLTTNAQRDGERGGDSGGLRVFAVSYRVDVAAGRSPDAFFRSLDRAVLALPLSTARPNLVVLPEFTGFANLFADPEGEAARAARNSDEALMTLAAAAIGDFPQLVERLGPQPPARLLLLWATHRLRHAFETACARVARKHGVWLIAGSAFADAAPDARGRLQPLSPEVYNRAQLRRPDGSLVGEAKKVHLTPEERDGGLCLSAAPLENLQVFDVAGVPVGIAICFDAFRRDVVAHLAAKGCRLLCQPAANDVGWADRAPVSGRYQPEEWLDALAKPLAYEASGIEWVASAMMVGNLLDFGFDGQSAIAARGPCPAGEPEKGYIGCRGTLAYRDHAHVAAVAPWAFPDPGGGDEERRAALRSLGRKLRPGSGDPIEDGYREGFACVDL